MTEFEKNAPTCAACKGTCCKVGFIVPVNKTDEVYNDERYVQQIDSVNGVRYMRSKGDGYTCIALGEQGECTIHEKRPKTCRDFAVNCDRCFAIRKTYGRP